MTKKQDYIIIDNPEDLIGACQKLQQASVLCVDTEFHRENTYYAQFALLQISSREHCFIIDPIAIDDLTPIWDVLCDENILKVFHACRQDVEIIFKETGKLPLPIFDTQVAAALLGYGLQVGFGNLVQRISKTVLPKQESFSDWISRPLTREQLNYAADDVIYLMPVYQHLQERLEARGRTEWLAEEQADISNVDIYETQPNEAFWRVKGVNKLKSRQLAVLRELASWREKEAKRKDIPRRRILADDPLIELAKKINLDLKAMDRMRGISTGLIKRHGAALISACERGQACHEDQWPRSKPRSLHTQGTDLRQELLDSLVRMKSETEEIASNILASKSDLAALASWGQQRKGEPPEVPCLHGWRKELVGNDLLRMLNGEISLRINTKSGLPIIEENP
ncbi:MAG: ribonuclease D [Mariprofundaceae bacterium]